MAAIILKWVIVFLAFMNAGYMAYDGTRALVTGDYLRPQSGEYAGQLGPWSKLVEKLGIDPTSTGMKSVFLIFGIAGLICAAGFAFNASWGWKALLLFNICSAWNLFFGTASSVVQTVLLIVFRTIK
ncbi:MAG: hypothetical protein AB1458_11520 [Bacteroidota bacterium]